MSVTGQTQWFFTTFHDVDTGERDVTMIANLDVEGTLSVNGVPVGTGTPGGTITLETPSGAANGSNTAFVFSAAPTCVFLNGILMEVNADFTLSSATVTFIVAPNPGDRVRGLVQ